MSQENVEVVRTLFDTFARRDHEAAFDYYASDIEWDASHAREVGDVDTAGIYHGHDGVRAYWRRWLSAWEDVEATEVEFVDAGQTVVALIHQQRLRGRGKTERSCGGSSIRRRQRRSKPRGCGSRRRDPPSSGAASWILVRLFFGKK